MSGGRGEKREESAFLSFLYHTPPGRALLKLAAGRAFSRAAGRCLDSPLSRALIGPFVKRYRIRLSDYTRVWFPSFNDFFSREIRPELRPVSRRQEDLIAPCDGLLSAFPITEGLVLPIKQSRYTVADLLGGDPIAARYRDGLCLVFRLCVDNYHRYCYVDDGTKGENVFLPGELHTVRPIALRELPVFVRNCREYTVLETAHFGTVAQIEVGAMLVGRIENRQGRAAFVRGQEKGMFRYGGSTVILLLEKGRAVLPEALLRDTQAGRETPVLMGQAIGRAADPNT